MFGYAIWISLDMRLCLSTSLTHIVGRILAPAGSPLDTIWLGIKWRFHLFSLGLCIQLAEREREPLWGGKKKKSRISRKNNTTKTTPEAFDPFFFYFFFLCEMIIISYRFSNPSVGGGGPFPPAIIQQQQHIAHLFYLIWFWFFFWVKILFPWNFEARQNNKIDKIPSTFRSMREIN